MADTVEANGDDCEIIDTRSREPRRLPGAATNEEAITYVERLLDRLKSGAAIGVVYVEVADAKTYYTFYSVLRGPDYPTLTELVGRIEVLKYDIIKSM